MFLKAQEWW